MKRKLLFLLEIELYLAATAAWIAAAGFESRYVRPHPHASVWTFLLLIGLGALLTTATLALHLYCGRFRVFAPLRSYWFGFPMPLLALALVLALWRPASLGRVLAILSSDWPMFAFLFLALLPLPVLVLLEEHAYRKAFRPAAQT